MVRTKSLAQALFHGKYSFNANKVFKKCVCARKFPQYAGGGRPRSQIGPFDMTRQCWDGELWKMALAHCRLRQGSPEKTHQLTVMDHAQHFTFVMPSWVFLKLTLTSVYFVSPNLISWSLLHRKAFTMSYPCTFSLTSHLWASHWITDHWIPLKIWVFP